MWNSYCAEVSDHLKGLLVTKEKGAVVSPDAGFSLWIDTALSLRTSGAIHLIGNGASASMASHFAADITKNCKIRAVVFTDSALITAMGNDYGYENCYSVALERYARPGDLLIAISSSGNSPNIVTACKKAIDMSLGLVTLSAMCPDNQIRQMGGLNFYIPAKSYGLAESTHSIILHHFTDLLESIL